jgi:Zn-dependent protease with chaperone function
MDFFQAQENARRRSGRLVLLFGLALLGTIAALYAAALLLQKLAGAAPRAPLWQPEVFGSVALLTLLVVGGAALARYLTLRAGGPAVAELVGGRRVSPDTTHLAERTLLNVVEEMALASGVPVPAVYLLPGETSVNAFAAGYSPADAALAFTDGALARLNRDELQGVVAHEFSHILNGDMRLNTRLSSLVHGLLALSILGRLVLRSASRLRVSTSSRRGGKGGGVAIVLLAGLVLHVVGYCGQLFGRLIQAAVSRQREFLADAAAVQFTRNPSGIRDALRRLAGAPLAGRLDSAHASELGHFCFAQPFHSRLHSLFATHPPLEERIRAIDPAWDPASAPPLAAADGPGRGPGPGVGFGAWSGSDAAPTPAFAAPPGAHRIDPRRLIDSSGETSPAASLAARALLAGLPDTLRSATQDGDRVPALCYALCLTPAADTADRDAALSLLAERAGASAARLATDLLPALSALPASQHLALLQLSAPALRALEPEAAATLVDTLQALTHLDGALTAHEFALQKIVSRTIGLAARPRDAVQVLAPNQVASELSLTLSVAARAEAADERAAAQAFARSAIEFNGLQPPLVYQPQGASTWEELDLALEHLAHTPAPFRRRVLGAIATALTADSRLTQSEADLLRALAATLDCPLPPVLPTSP